MKRIVIGTSLTLAFSFLLLSAPVLASSLTAEMRVPLAGNLAWAQDLAVDGDGNMYVLGRDKADRYYAVWKFSPLGSVVATFGAETLSRPGRLAVTAAGRVVVSEVCWTQECRAALLVFSPAGILEHEVVPPRSLVAEITSLGGERVAVASQYLDEGFHFDLHTIDAASGLIESSAVGFVSSTGVNKLYSQLALRDASCLRGIYVERAPTPDKLIAGYSGRNGLATVDLRGNTVSTAALTTFSPRPLATAVLVNEQEADSIAVAQGSIYNQDTTCGFFTGLAVDELGRTVVTGRGMAGELHRNEILDAEGKLVGVLESPYELNYTLTFENGRAYGLCNVGGESWELIRFAVES